MKPWKIVLVLNLALACGVGWGYAWWGRRADRMAEELVETRARAERLDRELRAIRPGGTSAGVQQWDVRGVVRGVVPDMQLVVLTHEEIPGLMSAMTMAFRVVAPELMQTVRVGDAVRFTLRGTPPTDVVLTAIQATK